MRSRSNERVKRSGGRRRFSPDEPGQIVVLNGVQRSGKTSIAQVIQETFAGLWMNIGVDAHIKCTPPAFRPGVGLRAQKPEWATPVAGRVPPEVLEAHVPTLYAALYESVAAHARLGLNVVMDVGHHEAYSKPLRILPDCARRLAGLPVLFIGVRCPVDVLWARREATWGQVRGQVDAGVAGSVHLGVDAVHAHGGYDLEVDTSVLSPDACAAVIRKRLEEGPPGSRFAELAQE
jgi:chloramphenicol 3-O phosphotransferase